MYHYVCSAKYLKVVISIAVDVTMKEICLEIKKRYEIHFLKIWTDGYFVNMVSKFGDETSISKYIGYQGLEKEYDVLHQSKQLVLF